MSYFQQFPTINYLGHDISDITIRVAMLKEVSKNTSAFEPYRIKNGDKLEDIAHKIYGDPQLLWIIMLTNDIIDPFYDWPMDDIELNEYTKGKYGTSGINDTHHCEDVNGRQVPTNTPSCTIITNSEYESVVNEQARNIRLLKLEHVSKVVNNFNRIMRSVNV